MKVAIIGNSGSGKTTLARTLAAGRPVPVLDLDTVFWKSALPEERPAAERTAAVQQFCGENKSWIIEGCYADLIEASFPWSPELIFLDPGREACLENCRRRPHEPHKYRTRAEQDARLEFLLKWVAEYYQRDGLMSHAAHRALFDRYAGPKRLIVSQDHRPPG